jgi:hypothetical protein
MCYASKTCRGNHVPTTNPGVPHPSRFLRRVGFHDYRSHQFPAIASDLSLEVQRRICGGDRFLGDECCLDFEGGGRRRSAGSGAAEHACCDSIPNRLLAHAGYGEPEARPACKVRGDSGSSDGAKALAIRAAGLPEVGTGCRAVHFGHAPASMRTVSTAADGQQLLRGGEREHSCRWQQRTKNAQQHQCCNPPHEVSLHATPCAEQKQ